MPIGTRHTLTGTLRRTETGYVLETHEGGSWRLYVSWHHRAWRHIGRRVIIEGTRAGFELLDVRRIRLREG